MKENSNIENTRENYYDEMKKEADLRNEARPRLKKIAGLSKQTPESRMELETRIVNHYLDKINAIDPNSESNPFNFPYDLKDMISFYQGHKSPPPPQEEQARPFTHGDKLLQLADAAIIHRAIRSEEIKSALLKKMEQYFTNKEEVTHDQTKQMEKYLEISEDHIPAGLAAILGKSNHYLFESVFQNRKIYLKNDFKEWFNNHQDQLLQTGHVHELLESYGQALEEKDKKEDLFFSSTEERDNFLLKAVARDESVIGRSELCKFYEESGLLDNEHTYRLIIQNAEDDNSIAGIYHDINEGKNKHAAAKTMFQSKEWRKANPVVLNWVTSEELWKKYVPLEKTQEYAQAAFDRYHEVLDQITDIKELTEPNKSLRKSGSKTGDKLIETLQNYTKLAEMTGRENDIEKSKQECERIFNIISPSLDIAYFQKNLFSHDQPFPEDKVDLLFQAKITSETANSTEQKELFNNIVNKIITTANKSVQNVKHLLQNTYFRKNFITLLNLGKFNKDNLSNQFGTIDKDVFDFLCYVKAANDRLYGNYCERRISDNIELFKNIDEVKAAEKFLMGFESHTNKIGLVKCYFALKNTKPHEQAAAELLEFTKKCDEIDPRLMLQPWLDKDNNLLLSHDRVINFIKKLYQRFGNNSLDLASQYMQKYKENTDISEDTIFVFLEEMDQRKLPLNIDLEPEYEKQSALGRENEWFENIRNMQENLGHAKKLTDEQRSSPNHLTMVKIVYPQSNYSAYEENEKLPDYNEHLKKNKFDENGYRMKMTGALGYERTNPEKPELLESYRQRMQSIREIASNPENVYKNIEQLLNKAQISSLSKNKNPLEYGADLLQLIMDNENRKQKKLTPAFTDQELADLAIAYHLRGQVEEFYHGTADQLSESGDQQTKDYIQWDALSRLYVEDGKQTLTTLCEELKKDEYGKKILTQLAEKYRSPNIPSETKLKEKLQPVMKDLKSILQKAPDVSKHRDIVMKRLDNSIVSFCQGIIKSFDDETRAKAINLIKQFVHDRLVPISGDYLENLDKPLYIQELRKIIDEFSFNPLQSVEKILTPDAATIQQEVGSYKVKMETDTTEEGKTVRKQATERNIIGYFSKTAEASNARGAARICIAGDTKMWENKNYFEFVMFNEDTKKCEGTVMLLNIEEGNKKYLLYCPNPSEHLISQVSFENCYKKITKIITDFAKENNYDGIVIGSPVAGRCSNRTGGFAHSVENARLKDKTGQLIELKLKQSYHLGGGYNYGGEKDLLHLIWKK